MPRRQKEERRILGPYRDGDEWRITVINPRATPKRRSFTAASRSAILETAKDIRDGWSELDEITVAISLEQYKRARMRDDTTEKSIDETVRRIKLMFADDARLVSELTHEDCSAAYDALVDRGDSAAYHRHILIQARSWLRWCVEVKKWLPSNPLDKVKGIGKIKKGKTQHTGDEARKLNAWLTWRAQKLDHAAIGLLMAQTMALRNGDVRKRLVLDVDMNATVLRMAGGKTAKSNRPRSIPSKLQSVLRTIVKGRPLDAPLFPTDKGGFHTKTWLRAAMKRFCRDAGVRYVCPHSLKGTAGTVLNIVGGSAEQIADFLSHEEVRTQEHYVDAGAAGDALQGRLEEMITEGEA